MGTERTFLGVDILFTVRQYRPKRSSDISDCPNCCSFLMSLISQSAARKTCQRLPLYLQGTNQLRDIKTAGFLSGVQRSIEDVGQSATLCRRHQSKAVDEDRDAAASDNGGVSARGSGRERVRKQLRR